MNFLLAYFKIRYSINSEPSNSGPFLHFYLTKISFICIKIFLFSFKKKRLHYFQNEFGNAMESRKVCLMFLLLKFKFSNGPYKLLENYTSYLTKISFICIKRLFLFFFKKSSFIIFKKSSEMRSVGSHEKFV